MLQRTSPHRSDFQLAVKVALTLFLTPLEVVLGGAIAALPPRTRQAHANRRRQPGATRRHLRLGQTGLGY
jgi:hypothetical protein